jgi:uncharacterized RDD family membrane protein YckC
LVSFIVDVFTITTLFVVAAMLYEKYHVTTPTYIFIIPLYYILSEAIWGQTFGKFVTGTIIVDKEGKVAHVSLAILRMIFRIISCFIPIILLVFRDELFHDKYSHTYVVNKKRWIQKYKTL